ncbi:MAG: 3-hydroxybutyryl-CoA dehydrogenase [Bdellovibrionales bacterium]|nr:3-hydroxybutyryl-CoA dehydrogenase [Bdellovibrionales bacterium]
MEDQIVIGILGAGTMGRGIAQVAAQAGFEVLLVDVDEASLEDAKNFIDKMLLRQAEKGKLSQDSAREAIRAIQCSNNLSAFKNASMVIEAVVEDLGVKQQCFKTLDKLLDPEMPLATNTSSLSVTEIASVCDYPDRVLGLHFFNPVPLMPLVEVVKGLQTSDAVIEFAFSVVSQWKKAPVVVADTPGFIVNRIARPFYSEALRIYEEGLAGIHDIDLAMRSLDFRMGPFELMDLIGNDVNLAVTTSVYEATYHEPRYRPSRIQQQLVAAGHWGKKVGRGYYQYAEPETLAETSISKEQVKMIGDRIVTMLINEAAEAVYYKIASPQAIDTAVTKGVNYPKGLCAWGDEIGVQIVLNRMQALHELYQEERYRPSVLLKKLASEGKRLSDM